MGKWIGIGLLIAYALFFMVTTYYFADQALRYKKENERLKKLCSR
ncbi:hypothetical protein [Candidatus Formimonas warabiya]|nr:hypothetical protein [Candidatus Formimonas warabiya]